ncbi:RloB family protein [uncultured Anaeromusa sp.]|uniref:RloB family protein n=1 Tax=uncultured Anaeromusa sp. TaxID=673273 RepID=UPI0029C89BFB|nr:RloB family protein [uncultured Anaeromusa sp.]
MGCDDLFKKAQAAKKKKRVKLEKPKILIVCEGEKTEPYYFEQFRPANVSVQGLGFNTLSLVQAAIKIRDDDATGFDQVWCVFDKDSFPMTNVSRAFSLAKKEDIHIAYSNEAFELWYILHFDFLQSAISRNDYIQRLNTLMQEKFNRTYRKNDRDMYRLLLPYQSVAIGNARKLAGCYQKRNLGNNPLTDVDSLVDELNKWRD